MADADRTDYHEDILPKDKSVIDCVRVACYINQIPLAMDMIKDAHDKGYETLLQLMAISHINEHDWSKPSTLPQKVLFPVSTSLTVLDRSIRSR